MLITFIRSVILYFLVIIAIRLMGKRQIGELQPSELVITILISEVAAIPMQENSLPLISAIIPVLVLVSLEIIFSILSMKSVFIRRLFSGRAIKLINNGKINQQKVKSLRFTLDDLLAALRQKDVFDISEVETAIVETNGTLSVFKKGEKQNTTAEMLGITVEECGIPIVFISDGKIVKENIGTYGITEENINKELNKKELKMKDVFIMTGDKLKKFSIVKKAN